MLVISLGAIAVKGLNLGIDFEGGTQIAFETPAPVALDEVRAQAEKIGQAGRPDPGSRHARRAETRTELLDPDGGR